MECKKWAELLLAYEMRQCGKVGRARDLKLEVLVLIIKN